MKKLMNFFRHIYNRVTIWFMMRSIEKEIKKVKEKVDGEISGKHSSL